MKWITREYVKVDRVACPWLIRKFVDKDAEFIFAPTETVILQSSNSATPMSGEGHSLHFCDVRVMSAFHPGTTKSRTLRHFGFGL